MRNQRRRSAERIKHQTETNNVDNAATVTCSSASDSLAATCDDGYWKNSDACTRCGVVTNAVTVTCSSAGNSVATTCNSGSLKIERTLCVIAADARLSDHTKS